MIKDIKSSIASYFKAYKLIGELKLWKYFFIPIGLGLILGGIFIGTAYGLSDNLGSLISNFWKWDFGKSIVTSISTIIGGLGILLIGIILYKHILMALSAPFMTPVSEKVEQYLTGIDVHETETKSNFMKQLVRSIRLNTRNLTIELLITIPLLFLSLIPVVGLIATFFLFYYQSFYTGFGNLDYTLERHLNYKESKDFVKKHKGIAIGNGLIFTLMLFIPLVGIMITLPISTIAATIDSVKKLHTEEKLVLTQNI